MKQADKKMKHVIVGAGLGGLIHGIMLKKARPGDDVILYDSNRHPGGFCNAFKKAATVNGEKVVYTINIPLLVSDFAPGEPLALFLEYLGVENLEWRIKNKLFQYYPIGEEPFLVTDKANEELPQLASTEKEKKAIRKFFKEMETFYNDIFHKAYVNPTAGQIIKMMFTMPGSIGTMSKNEIYLDMIERMGIETQTVKDILCAAEAFFGVDVDKVSAVGEMCLLQSFLVNNAEQPEPPYDFQMLSDRLADKFKELGGDLRLQHRVEQVLFDGKRAAGVRVEGKDQPADSVVLAVAQDRIRELIAHGTNIGPVKKLVKKIDKLPYPNSDFYCYYLIDKETIEKHPRFTDIAYHIYRLPEGRDRCNWKLAIWVPDELLNEKYYLLSMVMVEQDQDEVDRWMKMREEDYDRYEKEKQKMSDYFLEILQEVEPVFKENPPIAPVLTFSPASYLPYGSKFPISGLAQTPDNFLMTRMKVTLLDNLFISGGASFSAGVWGAIAGGWQGFVTSYKKQFGVQVGNHDVLYKPGMKNLP
jgi:hypothetical protein